MLSLRQTLARVCCFFNEGLNRGVLAGLPRTKHYTHNNAAAAAASHQKSGDVRFRFETPLRFALLSSLLRFVVLVT